MDINSNLHIDDIKVIESQFKINFNKPLSEWTEETPIRITPEFLINDSDSSIGRVRIEAEIFNEDLVEQSYPYHLRVIVQGQFSLLDKSEENIFEQYAVSMTSMLLPYVRSFIAAITGLSGMSAVHIPAVNVVRLFEELQEED